MPILLAWVFALLIASAAWLQVTNIARTGQRTGPVAPLKGTQRPQLEQVVITLSDGTEMAGKLATRPGDNRRWLQIEGLSTKLLRPVPEDRVLSIQSLTTRARSRKPATTDRPARTDAQQAHQLLFGDP